MYYIIVTPTIDNMGGAQMYVRNKLLFLESLGWRVQIITAEANKNILIPELLPYKDNHWGELRFNSYEQSRSRVKKVVSEILISLGRLTDESSIIVESTCMEEATWGEIIAQKLRAKHLFYSLQESNSATNTGVREFLIFKHDRREFAGIGQHSLYTLFKSFHPIEIAKSYKLDASANNVEADVGHPFIDTIKKNKYDTIIGCLSRLDKPFVAEGINGVAQYGKMHPEKNILLLLIGGGPRVYISSIQKILEDIPNIEIKITGYLYPIPTKLLDLCELFFASAGCARVCQRSGIPTISFDCNDLRPIGIMGRTTTNSMFRNENEPPLDFINLLVDTLDNNRYPKETSNYILRVPDYSSHLNFISQSKQSKSYYDVMSIKLATEKEKMRSIILKTLGSEFYTWLSGIRIKRK